MKAKIVYNDNGTYSSALEDSNGKYNTAPFTTFSKETAEKYADFASFMNLHDDLNKIVWPKRGGL